MKKYEDMINLPRPKSKTRQPMSMLNRAAQFSPFAALTGHEAAVKETARETEKRIELDPYMRDALDHKLEILMEELKNKPQVKIIHFQADEKKAGGKYIETSGTISKIDEYHHTIHMSDDRKIPIEDILDIEGRIFDIYCGE